MALTDKERARLKEILARIADGHLMTREESKEAHALVNKLEAVVLTTKDV